MTDATNAAKFKPGDIVRHAITGARFRVMFAPPRGRLKEDGCLISVYIYCREADDESEPVYVSNERDFEWDYEAATVDSPKRPINVDALASFIREIDGGHSLGAGAMAEHIAAWLEHQSAPIPEQEAAP